MFKHLVHDPKTLRNVSITITITLRNVSITIGGGMPLKCCSVVS